jgi:hypothetical protein
MNARLRNVFDTAERERKSILDLVGPLPDEKLFYHREKRWSISQILTHIIISERMSLQYMKKKSLGIDQLQNSGMIEEIKTIILKISQRLPLKYKAPKIVQESTPAALSLREIVDQWNNSRMELKTFLSSIEPKNIRKKIYKHPVAGRLDVTQAVTFLREHVNHHLPQIKRLLK